MYIRQEYLLSFEEIVKFQPITKIELILSQLNFTNILEELSKLHAVPGAKGHNELALIYSLVAMQVDKIKIVNGLVDRLKTDPVFPYVCGFDMLAIHHQHQPLVDS